jgi:hypothetical protein
VELFHLLLHAGLSRRLPKVETSPSAYKIGPAGLGLPQSAHAELSPGFGYRRRTDGTHDVVSIGASLVFE